MRPHVHKALAAFGRRHGAGRAPHIVQTARALAAEARAVDDDLLVFGAWLHGAAADEPAVRAFLADLGLEGARIQQIVQVAREAAPEGRPLTPEGSALHDAVLTQGGPAFPVLLALARGRAEGWGVAGTAKFLRGEVLGRHACVTPTGRAWHIENERYVRWFLNCVAPRMALQAGEPPLPEGPDPYADEEVVRLTCPWCTDQVALPESLVGEDVLCPACQELIYLSPRLEAVRSDLETVPQRARCPRCRSLEVRRPAYAVAGWVMIVVASVWLVMVLSGEPAALHPLLDPIAASLMLILGVEVVLYRPAWRCARCGHRWAAARRGAPK